MPQSTTPWSGWHRSFPCRFPLLDGQGNFGSLDGDNPAAMRYTEIRMAKAAQMLLQDIDRNTVEFQDNYDGKDREPTVLPARFPNILVNGGSGIAVGMATNIPPHNLGEVIDGTLAMIENPDISLERLMELIPGPDFPTGGIIQGRMGARKAYVTGRGGIVVRAKTRVEEIRKDRFAIIVEEIPYQVNKSQMIERIAQVAREGKIQGISNIQDRIRQGGSSCRHRIETGRDSGDRAEPTLAIYQYGGVLQLQPAGTGRRKAGISDALENHKTIHRLPGRNCNTKNSRESPESPCKKSHSLRVGRRRIKPGRGRGDDPEFGRTSRGKGTTAGKGLAGGRDRGIHPVDRGS